MSMSVGGGGFGVKRHAFQQNAEMNVTPFVDVMLVLLIIFMVAAPLATVNVPLDLPPASANPNPPPREPIFISIQRDGSLFVGDDKIDLAYLPTTLLADTEGDREQRIFLRCDQNLVYGRLMEVMNILQDNGYYKIGLVAEEVNK